MASPRKSPQHEEAHSPQASQYPGLEITNKIDVASFVDGVTSTTPVKKSYYDCRFESPQHKSFYLILEATRRVNKAVLTYKGRKADIKRARFSRRAIQDIYEAGVMSGGGLEENLKRAIHEASSHPTYQKELFEKA